MIEPNPPSTSMALMSPRLRHAISVQGTLLSRQADALTQMSAAQQDLFRRLDSITHTLAGLTRQPSHPTVAAQAAASGNNPTSADAMTPENIRLQPEPFSGDVAACGGFLLQCQLIFQQAPRFYQSDHSRISLIVNSRRNKALQWAQAFLASNPISHLPFDLRCSYHGIIPHECATRAAVLQSPSTSSLRIQQVLSLELRLPSPSSQPPRSNKDLVTDSPTEQLNLPDTYLTFPSFFRVPASGSFRIPTGP
uniref:DUF4939 domain-containing protein n=1 Tax=Oryzias latipes TaxID=8090 RepID=A0A3P9H871_ORYLA